MDETLQAVNHQSARLKSDLRVLQQEKDSLMHDVAVLHKQLQNVNEKVRFYVIFRLADKKHTYSKCSKSMKKHRDSWFSWCLKMLKCTDKGTDTVYLFSRLDLLLLFITEPCFGDGLALEWSPASEQEAVQRWDVSADGAGSAAAEAGKREASGRSIQHQRRPHAVQREGEPRMTANCNGL